MRKNLLRVSRIPRDGSFPSAISTIYKWRHINKYPELFIKISGALFIDLDELDRIIEQCRGK